jgi:phosphate transport system substrate-binding protein
MMSPTKLSLVVCLALVAPWALLSCSRQGNVIRITGSDTMVNLVQAWAEEYEKHHAEVSVQVAGGGSGVGIAALINGDVDIAASSREMEPEEKSRARARSGVEPQEIEVGLDALAIYVHKDNPLDTLSVEQLAEIYGDGGKIENWSQLGISNPKCNQDRIIRVSRQNNSGTYFYFREAILGNTRELKQGSLDQSGSKDVVELVSTTPCAIGYSGMAYATPGVKTLKVSKKNGDPAIVPCIDSAMDRSYPISRPLFLYAKEEPKGALKEFLDWVVGPEGQKVVEEVGYVPLPRHTASQ